MVAVNIVVTPALEESVLRLTKIIDDSDVSITIMISRHELHHPHAPAEYAWIAKQVEGLRSAFGVSYYDGLETFYVTPRAYAEATHAAHRRG